MLKGCLAKSGCYAEALEAWAQRPNVLYFRAHPSSASVTLISVTIAQRLLRSSQ